MPHVSGFSTESKAKIVTMSNDENLKQHNELKEKQFHSLKEMPLFFLKKRRKHLSLG